MKSLWPGLSLLTPSFTEVMALAPSDFRTFFFNSSVSDLFWARFLVGVLENKDVIKVRGWQQSYLLKVGTSRTRNKSRRSEDRVRFFGVQKIPPPDHSTDYRLYN